MPVVGLSSTRSGCCLLPTASPGKEPWVIMGNVVHFHEYEFDCQQDVPVIS